MENKFNLSLIGLCVFFVLFLMGCKHTVEGFGQDMEQNGQDIRHAVDHLDKSS